MKDVGAARRYEGVMKGFVGYTEKYGGAVVLVCSSIVVAWLKTCLFISVFIEIHSSMIIYLLQV